MEKLESLDQILEILRTVKPDVESRYQVDELAIFGSYELELIWSCGMH
jgi:predicted nucleotidyltransferase